MYEGPLHGEDLAHGECKTVAAEDAQEPEEQSDVSKDRLYRLSCRGREPLTHPVEVLKDKDLAFARLLQFKAFSEIGIALASKIKYNENEIKSFKYYQTKNLFPKPDVEYEINKDKFNEVAIEVFDRFKTIEGFKHIDKDLPDLQKAIDDLLQAVDKRLNTSFESILNEVNTEKEAIAFFLALLEAVRWGFVKASQNDDGIKIEKNYEL